MNSTFKKIVILLIINFLNIGFAQEKISEVINKSTNVKLKEVYYEQEIIFRQLENFLNSNEINNEVLVGFYNKTLSTNRNFYTAITNKLESELIERYYIERLSFFDTLYSSYKEATKIIPIKSIAPEDDTTIDISKKPSKAPSNPYSMEGMAYTGITIPESNECSKMNPSPTNCAQMIISKYYANRIQIPDIRSFEESKYVMFINFIITKEGNFEIKNISNSKKYFDLEMEVLKVSLSLSKNKKFIPGTQNGKAVNFSYQLPINLYMVID